MNFHFKFFNEDKLFEKLKKASKEVFPKKFFLKTLIYQKIQQNSKHKIKINLEKNQQQKFYK